MKPTVRPASQRARPSYCFVLVGAMFGLIPAASLGVLRAMSTDGPVSAEAISGSVASALIYTSPYLVALRQPMLLGKRHAALAT